MKNYEKIFSKNLKNLRKTFHISQKQLADDLGYSEKTISKWEAAAGLPNIATAYEIAKIFRVSIDDLFNHEHQICFLGIDGGGTKTELVLTDSNQKVIRTLLVEGCNPMDIGIEETKRILREAIWKVCEDIPYASISMFAGIAGGTTGNMKSELNRFFKDFKFYSYANDSDNLNIISAGLEKKDGIILILGTGVCAYTQVKGEHIRTAGWGYLIDNGGSAYNIGRDGLNAYYCEKDKTGSKTLLTDIIESSYEGDENLLIQEIYDGKKKVVASFAPAVYQAADKGDVIAQDIIKRNMAAAAAIVETAGKPLQDAEKIPVVIAGGLSKEPRTKQCLTEMLKQPEKYEIEVLDKRPVWGAVMLAQQLYERERSE